MEAGAATQSRLIGAILVENGLITREQLVRALEIHAETGERLGEIVVAEFDVPRIELASILAEQWAAIEGTPSGGTIRPAPQLRVVAAPSPETTAARRPIGEIFLELGFIDQEQLDAALEQQRETGARIGEVLVEQGSLTRLDLASALAEQWTSLEKLRPPSPDARAQDRRLAANAPEPGSTSNERAALGAHAERLAAIEEAIAAGSAGAVDLEPDLAQLRAAIASLEARVEVVSRERLSAEDLTRVAGTLETRIDALEGRDSSNAIANLRLELDELRSRPNVVTEIAELRAMVDRLDGQSGTPGQIEALASEIAKVSARLDDRTALDELESRVDAAALQAAAAAGEAARLSGQLDALSSLEQRIEEIGARVPAEGEIDGMVEQLRGELEAVEANRSPRVEATNDDAIAAISSRIDLVAARLDELAAGSTVDLRPTLEALTERVDATAASTRTATEVLGERLASLEHAAEEGGGALERIAAELEELDARARERLVELGKRSADSTPLDAVQSRLDDLAGSVAQVSGPLEDLAARVTALAGRGDTIAALESRIGELETGVAEGSSATDLREEIRLVAESTAADRASLAETLLARVEEVAAAAPREEELAELRARLDQVVALPAEDETLRQKVDALASRLEALGAVEKSIGDVREIVEAAIVAEAVARETRLDELEQAIDGLKRQVHESSEERASLLVERTLPFEVRLDGAEARIDELASLTSRVESLALELEGRASDEKLAEAIAEVRSRVESLAEDASTAELAERVSELAVRLDDEALRKRVESIAQRVDTVEVLEASIADMRQSVSEFESVRVADALASGARLVGIERLLGELATRDSVDAALAGLRAELDAVAAASTTEDLDHRIADLMARVDRVASDVDDSLIGVAEELTNRIDANAAGLGKRVDELAERVTGFVGRGELDDAAARHVEWVRSELAALAEAGEARAARLEESLATVDLSRLTSEQQGRDHMEESLAAIWAALHERQLALDPQLEAQSAELTALRAQLVELHEDRAARVDMGVQLNDRITSELASLRAHVSQETTVARAETASLGARIDELLGLRFADNQAARAADERLLEQIDALAARSDEEHEAARSVASDLSHRLGALSDSVGVEMAAVRGADAEAAARLNELERLRAEDAAAAASVSSGLAGRLDELDGRTTTAAADVELRLRGDLNALAARVEELDGASIEAREDLRVELERLAASLGWRLERIEESLATNETATLRATVAELEGRLERQVALGEEQVRATERALRKGLASLGERLVDSESAYVEAGNTLRRSIDRLGAAVVEADARMADQIPISALEGCVAFAPTDDGYRLIELQGEPPAVGAIVDVEAANGPLVVTRYGRSPLPFDGRPCAYLDRV